MDIESLAGPQGVKLRNALSYCTDAEMASLGLPQRSGFTTGLEPTELIEGLIALLLVTVEYIMPNERPEIFFTGVEEALAMAENDEGIREGARLATAASSDSPSSFYLKLHRLTEPEKVIEFLFSLYLELSEHMLEIFRDKDPIQTIQGFTDDLRKYLS